MRDFFLPLCQIQKLGEALRKADPSWKIIHIQESWQGEEWIREICHACDSGTLVYAQTIVPQQTYLAYEAELHALGSRSIGDHFLFKRQDVYRSPFQCTVITEENSLYPAIVQHLGSETQFYKRESVFKVKNDRLSISEYFGCKALSLLELDLK